MQPVNLKIDSLGRIWLPKSVLEQLNWTAGDMVTATITEANELYLRICNEPPTLIRGTLRIWRLPQSRL